MHVSMALKHPLNQFFVLESTRLSLTSDMQVTPLLWQKVKRKVKKESEKAGLKLNLQKTKIMASGPIISW